MATGPRLGRRLRGRKAMMTRERPRKVSEDLQADARRGAGSGSGFDVSREGFKSGRSGLSLGDMADGVHTDAMTFRRFSRESELQLTNAHVQIIVLDHPV